MPNEYDEKKYISCKNCGCELEADWRKCPYCKAINTLAPKGSSKKLLVIIISVVCVIAVCLLMLLIMFNRPNSVLNPDRIRVYTVLNGSGNAVIGERAEIIVSKASIKELSPEEFNDFLENEISGSGYNWFTIDFNDGTGIQFFGCDIEIPCYGILGDEGIIKKTTYFIKRHKTDNQITFEYEPAS